MIIYVQSTVTQYAHPLHIVLQSINLSKIHDTEMVDCEKVHQSNLIRDTATTRLSHNQQCITNFMHGKLI